MVAAERIECFVKRYEVAGYEPRSLVNQLVERVLPIRSRLAPVDRASRVSYLIAVESDVFAVAVSIVNCCRMALGIVSYIVRKEARRPSVLRRNRCTKVQEDP